MNPSKNGLSSAGKTGIVVVLIVIVLAAAYLVPSLSKGGGGQSATSNASEDKITGMLTLFADFPQMQVTVNNYDAPDGFVTNESMSYTVLAGTATMNSTKYTRVEFSTVGQPSTVIGWFNSTGGIGDVEVLGQPKNYTGSGAYALPFIQIYTNAFGGLVSITDNSTLVSHLSMTSQGLTNLGPTQMDVTAYSLIGVSPPYSSFTLRIATIPGTSVQLAVYVNEKTTDGSTSLVEVTSLTR